MFNAKIKDLAIMDSWQNINNINLTFSGRWSFFEEFQRNSALGAWEDQ